MKLIKMSSDHYIIVDDSEIKIGDIIAEKLITGKNDFFEIHTLNDIDKSCQKVVIYSTQPLEYSPKIGKYWNKVQPLSLSEVKELLGEVDVEKKAEEVFPYKETRTDFATDECRRIYKSGYNQALEDNKDRKYTKEDVIAIVEKSRVTGLTAEYLILSLQPSTSWDVTFIDGKLKLK